MFQRMFASALIAGGAAGLIAALLHFVFVQDYILLGERYETGELTHFSSGSSQTDAAVAMAGGAGHDHGHDATSDASAAGDHAHDHGDQAGGSGLGRDGLTVVFTVLIYASYAMVLTAGFGLIAALGHKVDGVAGLLWGLGGYASFQLAPAMGLAPELPGTIAAELSARQVWWWGTVICTGAGLGLLAYGPVLWAKAAGVVLLALPHVIGAPVMDAYWGVAPPEVGAAFSARVLGVGLVVWATMGWIAGQLWHRDDQAA
jgi:cobalt transporter subunit CbtA